MSSSGRMMQFLIYGKTKMFQTTNQLRSLWEKRDKVNTGYIYIYKYVDSSLYYNQNLPSFYWWKNTSWTYLDSRTKISKKWPGFFASFFQSLSRKPLMWFVKVTCWSSGIRFKCCQHFLDLFKENQWKTRGKWWLNGIWWDLPSGND